MNTDAATRRISVRPKANEKGQNYPEESRGLGSYPLASVEGVNDSSAELVKDFIPTRYELGVLANHYLEESAVLDYDAVFFRSTGSWELRISAFSNRRLNSIANCLGDDAFDKATAEMRDRWATRFREAKETIEAAIPCKRCGMPRTDPYDALCFGQFCARCR